MTVLLQHVMYDRYKCNFGGSIFILFSCGYKNNEYSVKILFEQLIHFKSCLCTQRKSRPFRNPLLLWSEINPIKTPVNCNINETKFTFLLTKGQKIEHYV